MDAKEPDESFCNFLNRCCPDSNADAEAHDARERALAYVVGFNAADPELVGVHWLVNSMRAEERIEGDRAFRSLNGYRDLIEIFFHQLMAAGVSVRIGAVVDSIAWSAGYAELTVSEASGRSKLEAPRVLITLPLAVLQTAPGETGAVDFSPALPARKLEALAKLEVGKVVRISLRFRHRFWEEIPASDEGALNLGRMRFLFSEDEWFSHMVEPGSRHRTNPDGMGAIPPRRAVSGKSLSFVVEQALQALSRLLKVSSDDLARLLEAEYFHNWQSDPFSRGAYSYGKVGADGAQEALASPVENTLFFAGEATRYLGAQRYRPWSHRERCSCRARDLGRRSYLGVFDVVFEPPTSLVPQPCAKPAQ